LGPPGGIGKERRGGEEGKEEEIGEQGMKGRQKNEEGRRYFLFHAVLPPVIISITGSCCHYD